MSEIPEDIRRDAAWIAAKYFDINTTRGEKLKQDIAEALWSERKKTAPVEQPA